MSYEAEEADAANNHGQDHPCRCDYSFTCGRCLRRSAERSMAERYMPPRRTTFFGTVMFGEVLIHPEP